MSLVLSVSQVHACAGGGDHPFCMGSDIQYILQLVDEGDNELCGCVALRAGTHMNECVLMESSWKEIAHCLSP